MLKRILAVALAAAMILGLASVTFAASPFPDTAGIEEEETIALLKTLGLVKGDDLGYFNPNDTITRAEFCAMIVRALGLEAAAGYLSTPTVFPDVTPAQAWAYGYINVAVTRGIIKGYPDGTFRPQGPVTQAEALTMIMRALGYNDNLPGDWPIDYIMAGAQDGLIEAGFAPSASATRAFVADMIGRALGTVLVYEPNSKDNPGVFEPVVSGVKFVKFGEKYLKVLLGDVKGMVTKVSTSSKKIWIDEAEYDYVSDIVVYGVGSVGELKGYKVNAVVTNDGDIVFVSTKGIDYISGKITAVNVSDGTLTVGGKVYDVVDELSATKNGELLSGTLAGKLVALVDTTANIWLNTSGDVYRIEARLLTESAVIENKAVTATVDGMEYVLTFDDGSAVPLAKEVTLSRNGVAAGWADLKVGDRCDYAEDSGKIVWLDAWNQVIEAAQVTSKLYLGSSNRQITALVNGVSTTYQCTEKGFNAITSVNSYWDLKIDRDGTVYDASESKSTGDGYGIIAGVSIEASSNGPLYKVTLADGSSFTVKIGSGFKVVKNKLPEQEVRTGDEFISTFKVGDAVTFTRQPAGGAESIKLYSPVFEGVAVKEGSDLKIKVGETLETSALNLTGASITLNGSYASLDSINGKKVRVTWDAKKDRVAKIEAYDVKGESAVAAISSDIAGNYLFRLANGTTITGTDDTIVLRDGAKAALEDIVIGDKVSYAEVDTGDNNKYAAYIEATPDTKKPALDGDDAITVVWTASQGTENEGFYTLTIKFNEEVQPPTVWIDGTEVKFEAGSSKNGGPEEWTYKSPLIEASKKPNTVSIALTVKDYAGNVLNATPGPITVKLANP